MDSAHQLSLLNSVPVRYAGERLESLSKDLS